MRRIAAVVFIISCVATKSPAGANASEQLQPELVYEVWAGNTDYGSQEDCYDVFRNIDQYDYVRLGSASGTASFWGSYEYYVIATRRTLYVDAIQELSGDTYINDTVDMWTWNVNDSERSIGPTDGEYATLCGFLRSEDYSFGAVLAVKGPANPEWDGIRVIVSSYGEPSFDLNSADLSDVPFVRARPGDTRTYHGRGAWTGETFTQVMDSEVVLGVSCLRMQLGSYGEDFVAHVAKDIEGNCWLFKFEEYGEIMFEAISLADVVPVQAIPHIIAHLAATQWNVGDTINPFNGNIDEIVDDSATLPEFPGWQLVKVKWTSFDGLDVDWLYYHDSVGLVLEVWDDTGNTMGDGWILGETATWTLIIEPPDGNGTIFPAPGTYTYDVGQSSAPITAIPETGWRFSHWLVNGSWGPSNSVIVVDSGYDEEIKTVQAIFVEDNTWSLTIEPPIGNGATTPPAGSYTYYSGQPSEPVYAIPASGWGFDHWEIDGGDWRTANPATFYRYDSPITPVFAQFLLRTFLDNKHPVCDVAFSPDGTKVLTGSLKETWAEPEGSAQLWDSATGDLIRTLTTAPTYSVAFSPCGTRVLTGHPGGACKLWDVATGVCIREFVGETADISSVAFSPDGSKIVTGSGDYMKSGNIRVWDVQSATCILTLSESSGNVSVVFSPDGTKVLHTDGAEAVIWDVLTGERLRTFWENDIDIFNNAVFSPDGTKVLTGTSESVKLWDIETGACVRIFDGAGPVAFSPDGTHIAILDDVTSHQIKLLNSSTGVCARTFEVESYSGYVTSVSFSNDGTKVLGGYDETQFGAARIWSSGLQPQQTWTLTIETPQGNGSTLPDAGTYTYDVGEASESIEAAPEAGWNFDHWQGTAVSGNPNTNPIIIPSGTAGQVQTLRAVFVDTGTSVELSAGDVMAAPGSEGNVSLILTIPEGLSVTTMQFKCTVTPASGSPPAVSQVRFTPAAEVPAPNLVDSTTVPGSVLVAWFLHISPPLNGTVELGTIDFDIPASCSLGDTYTLTISNTSGTHSGTPVPMISGSAGTVTVAGNWYLVGDVYPPTGTGGGEFGDGVLDNADVVHLFYRSMGTIPSPPPQGSDAWDAGDIYPKDDPPQAGGDGTLNNADVVELFYRSLLAQTSYERVLSGAERISRVYEAGMASVQSLSAQAANTLYVEVQGTFTPGGVCEIPLILSLQPGDELTSLQFNCTVEPVGNADAIGAVQYLHASEIPAPSMNDSETLPGSVLVAWFVHMPNPLQGLSTIGNIRFTVPSTAKPGDKWLITIVNPSATNAGVPLAIGPGPDGEITIGLSGDANGDCSVDFLDLIFVRNRLRQDVNAGDNKQADVNGDGAIDVVDLVYVRNRKGNTCDE